MSGNPTAGIAPGSLQNNYAATVAPTITDDSSAGYAVGSRWVDTVSGIGYICTNATAGAAVWTVDADPNAGSVENSLFYSAIPDSIGGFSGTMIGAADLRYTLVDNSGSTRIEAYDVSTKEYKFLTYPPNQFGGTILGYSGGFIAEEAGTYYCFAIFRELVGGTNWQHFVARYDLSATSPITASITTVSGKTIGDATATAQRAFNSAQNKLLWAYGSQDTTSFNSMDIWDVNPSGNSITLANSITLSGAVSAAKPLMNEAATAVYFNSTSTLKLDRKWVIATDSEDASADRRADYEMSTTTMVGGKPYTIDSGSGQLSDILFLFPEY